METGKAIKSIIDGTYPLITHPDVVPQNATYPAVVYTLVSAVPSDNKDEDSPIDFERWQIDVYCTTYTQSVDYARAIRNLLDRYAHTTVENVNLAGVKFLGYNPAPIEDDLDLYRQSMDFQFRIRL